MKHIVPLLTKVQVSSQCKDIGKLREGSSGFVAEILCGGSYNRLVYYIILTRVGKGGKPRMEAVDFTGEFIDTSELPEDKKALMTSDYAKEFGLYDKRVHLDGVLETLPLPKNLLELETRDFIAYTTAFSLFLNKMCNVQRNMDVLQRVPFAELQKHPRTNTILSTNPVTIRPTRFYDFVLTAYRNDTAKKVEDHMNVYDNAFGDSDIGRMNRNLLLRNFHKELTIATDAVKMTESAIRDKKHDIGQRMDMLFREYL